MFSKLYNQSSKSSGFYNGNSPFSMLYDGKPQIDPSIQALCDGLAKEARKLESSVQNSPSTKHITIRQHDQNTPLSLFERSCCTFPQLLSLIFDYNSNIIFLRLVSLKFYELVNRSGFLKKIYIPFSLINFQNPSFEEKLDFAKQNSNIHLVISEPLSKPSYLSDISLMCNSLSEKTQLKITLVIEKKEELENVEQLLSNKSDLKIANKICAVELRRGKIGSDFDEISRGDIIHLQKFFTIISENENLLTNLQTLILKGDISCSIAFELSRHLKILKVGGIILGGCEFELKGPTKNLEQLDVKFIRKKFDLTLTDSFKNLRILNVGPINNASTLSLADGVDNLESLTIGNIKDNAEIELPRSLNNLRTLTLGEIEGQRSKITLPISLDNLRELVIGKIWSLNKIILPNSLPNLKICKTKCNAIKFPNSLPRLIILEIGDIFCDYKLPESLNNLQRLTIGRIVLGLNLPNSLDNLVELNVGNIASYSTSILRMPKSLNNLKTLTIGNIGNRESFQSDKGEIIINSELIKSNLIAPVLKNASVIFPSEMDNLTNLTFGNIDSTAILTLPKSLKNLKNLNAGIVENEAVIQQFELIKQTTNAKVSYTKNLELCCCQ